MKNFKLLLVLTALSCSFNYSCKESASEKLENEMETHSENLETRSENMEDATDLVVEGFDDMEEAIKNFKNALEAVENSKDRQEIRRRINAILDDMDLQKKDN